MANHAPLRELCVRVFGTHALFEEYLPQVPALAGVLGPLLQGQEDGRLTAAYRELDAVVRAEFARAADDALAQARCVERHLRGLVRHPAEEQAAAVGHLLTLRAAISGGQKLPPIRATIDVAVRLWTLGEMRHEPTKFALSADVPGKVGRKPGGQKAIDYADLAHGLFAIQDGRATSIRQLASLLGTSPASVGRNETLGEALRQQKRLPRTRGFRKTDGEVEAIDPGENETGNETADS